MEKFQEEIKAIVRFAKRIKYNLEEGSIEDLLRLWLKDLQKMYNNMEDEKR